MSLMLPVSLLTSCAGASGDGSSTAVSAITESAAEATTQEAEPEPETVTTDHLAEAVAGTWYAEMEGMPLEMELKTDGTYTMTILPGSEAAETQDGTWRTDGTGIYFGEEETTSLFIVQAEKWEVTAEEVLAEAEAENAPETAATDAETDTDTEPEAEPEMQTLLAWEEANVFFSREAPEYYQPGAVKTDTKSGDLDGYWVSAFVGVDGALLDAAVFDDHTDIYIEGSKVALGGYLFGDVTEDFTFADGVLTYSYGEGEQKVTIRMALQEDGLLRMALNENTEDAITLYLVASATDDGETAEG